MRLPAWVIVWWVFVALVTVGTIVAYLLVPAHAHAAPRPVHHPVMVLHHQVYHNVNQYGQYCTITINPVPIPTTITCQG